MKNGKVASAFIANAPLYWRKILQCSIVQETIDRLRVLYVAEHDLPQTLQDEIHMHFEKRLLPAETIFERTDASPRLASGKLQRLTSNAPLPED